MQIVPAVLFAFCTYLPYVVQSSRLNKRGLNSFIYYYPVERKHTRVFASKTWIHSRASPSRSFLATTARAAVDYYCSSQQALWLPGHNIQISDVLSWLKRRKTRSSDEACRPPSQCTCFGSTDMKGSHWFGEDPGSHSNSQQRACFIMGW